MGFLPSTDETSFMTGVPVGEGGLEVGVLQPRFVLFV